MGKQTFAIPEDFRPEPTPFTGGLDRMLQLFEALRDNDPKGYTGGSIVGKVKGWSVADNGGTSCSPFTATVVGMLWDPSGETSGSRTYEPVYNVNASRQEPLPVDFYSLHQGNQRGQTVMKRIAAAGNGKGVGSAESLVAFGLGYRVDPKDMRRGDFVGIDWNPKGGHATFCWDVHLNAQGEVDCFEYVSANGVIYDPKTKKKDPKGPGVSVGAGWVGCFLDGTYDGRDWKKKFNPLFQDRDEYVKYGSWIALQGVSKGQIDLKSFRAPPKFVGYNRLNAISVVRLYGMKPPGDASHPRAKAGWDKAATVGQWDPPDSYAMGGAAAEAKPTPTVTQVKPQSVPAKDGKADPDAVQKAKPDKVEQKKEAVHGFQYDVELKLKKLFEAGWIDSDPGDPDDVNDAKSKAAIKAFQAKYGKDDGLEVDGIAGPKTRPVLDRVFAKHEAGDADPNAEAKDDEPELAYAYWLKNPVEQGGSALLKLEGTGLDKLTGVKLALTDYAGHGQELDVDAGPAKSGGALSVQLGDFPDWAMVSGIVTATFDGAGDQKRDVAVVLVVSPRSDAAPAGPATIVPDNLLPWDESKWPRRMRDVLAELRSTAKPESATLEKWSLTQFGVKTKIDAGDTPVLADDGSELGRVALASLMKADIEGTMLLNGRMLNISKSHGWDYDKKTHKPVKGSFQPQRSRWIDVTATRPFGAGARLPLIPFRVLAMNPGRKQASYFQKVYVKQLDGLVLPTGETHNGIVVVGDCGGMVDHHFDFFVANEDHHLRIPKVGDKDGRQLVELALLGTCEAAKKK